MTRNNIKSFSLATGAALVLGALSGTAMADQANPFAMTELSQGYAVAAAEGKCGEAKCGGNKQKAAESKCGGKEKTAEAKCGGMEKKAEAKCGGNKEKTAEAKCGGSK